MTDRNPFLDFMKIADYSETRMYLDKYGDLAKQRYRDSFLVHRVAAMQSEQAVNLMKALVEYDAKLLQQTDRFKNKPIQLVSGPDMAVYIASVSSKSDRKKGITAAIARDDIDIVEALLDKHESVDVSELVHTSIVKGAVKTLSTLVARAGNVSLKEDGVWKHVQHVKVAEILIAHGHNPTPEDCECFNQSDVAGVVFAMSPELFTGRALARWIPSFSDLNAREATERLAAEDVSSDLITAVAAMNSVELVTALLNRNRGIDLVDSAAIAACRHGAVEVLQLLINNHSPSNYLPLYAEACEYCHLDIWNVLAKHDIPYATLNDAGETALHVLGRAAGEAIGNYRPSRNYAELMKLALNQLSSQIDKTSNERGDTALHVSVRESNWTFVEALVSAGADTAVVNKEGITAMQIAEKQDSLETYLALMNR